MTGVGSESGSSPEYWEWMVNIECLNFNSHVDSLKTELVTYIGDSRTQTSTTVTTSVINGILSSQSQLDKESISLAPEKKAFISQLNIRLIKCITN